MPDPTSSTTIHTSHPTHIPPQPLHRPLSHDNAQASSSKLKLESPTPPVHNGSSQGNGVAAQSTKALGKRRRTDEEQDYVELATSQLMGNLELDQQITHSPAQTSPFVDAADVVERLLPWHIWQVHDQDLDYRPKTLERNKRELNDVAVMVKRKNALEERLKALRQKGDDTNHHLPTVLLLENHLLSHGRSAAINAQNTLRDIRAEYDALSEKQRRMAEAEARRKQAERDQARVAQNRAAGPSGGQYAQQSNQGQGQAGKSQMLNVNIPMNHVPRLTELLIVDLSGQHRVTPASVVSTSQDLSFITILVNVSACNPQQITFLADILQKQKGQAKGVPA